MNDTYKILLDVDGVLADFSNAVQDFYNCWITPYPMGTYNIVDLICTKKGIIEKDFWEQLGVYFWANIPLLQHAEDLLNLLKGLNVCVLTSPPLNHEAVVGKLLWLEKHTRFVAKRKFLIGPAKEFCANKNHILIDDSDENIDNFIEHGGKAVLYPTKQNSAHFWHDLPNDYVTECLDGHGVRI